MRLIVRDERGHFNQQTHAYAEYRAFSAIAGSDLAVAEVTVTLERPASDGSEDGGRVRCTVAMTLETGELAETGAVARHAYAAIDRAVSLIRRPRAGAMGRPADSRFGAADRESA